MVSYGIIRLLDFLIFFGYCREYVFSVVKVLFSFVLRYFCKRCVFIHLLHLFLALFTFWCAGSVRISLAGRVIYFLCGTPLCGVPGRYDFISALLGADGGTVQIFPFLWLCCSGYGIVEMTRGVVRGFLLFFNTFPSLLSVLSVVGCLR